MVGPDEFDTIRTTDWAEHAASSVAAGAEVRTGHHEGGADPDRHIQGILVPTDNASDEGDAIELAEAIVEKLNSCWKKRAETRPYLPL